MIDRLPCIVPFCKRTGEPKQVEHDRLICQKHWSATDRSLRRKLFKARKFNRYQLEAMIWKRLEQQAIHRSFGIG